MRNFRFNLRLVLSLALLAIVAIGLVLGISNVGKQKDQRASAATTPDRVDFVLEGPSSVGDNETFNVNIVIDSNLSVSGAHFTLEYNQAELQGVELRNTGPLSQNLVAPAVGSGTMSATFGAPLGNPARGRQVIATAVFRALGQSDSTTIRIRNNGTTEPEITATEFLEGDTNRTNFSSLQPLSINIGNTEATNAPPQQRVNGDCSNDGRVNLADFNQLIGSFGQNVSPNTACDFNNDGRVHLFDFNAVIMGIVLSATGGPLPTTSAPGGLEFEAESGTLTAPFQSNGGYVFQTTRNTSGTSGGGVATYNVNIPQAGNYEVQGLVCAATIDNNSVFIDFDNIPASNEVWIMTPNNGNCSWQTANWRLNGGAESPELNPVVFNLTAGQHQLRIIGREDNAKIDKLRIVQSGATVPTSGPQPTNPPQPTTQQPTSGPQPTTGPTAPVPTSGPVTPFPTITGDFPCGIFPNARPGCEPISYQAWLRDVPSTGVKASELGECQGSAQGVVQTMDVNFTPCLGHWHVDYAMPWEQFMRVPMKLHVNFTSYNLRNDDFPVWMRTQNQGSTYEQYNTSFPHCQTGPFEGKECKSQHVSTVRAQDFANGTEIRFSPNDGNSLTGLGRRWYLSTNWQTGDGYRANDGEKTARENLGSYLRMILGDTTKYLKPGESIPTVSGTISIPVKTSGGIGGRKKVFAFLDPAQHKRVYGTQTGYTLLEHEGFFNGNFTWDTTTLPAGKMANGQTTPAGTRTPNGVHSILFIVMEGDSQVVHASGIAILMNIQNP